MRLFIGRFWSFRPEHLPFITFARAVYRDSLLADCAAGDRIAIVVTRKESVIPQNRGRLLGMAEIGAYPVDTADVASPATMTPREWLGGEPRCPKAIPMLRAWRFLQPTAVPVVIDAALQQTTGGPAILLTAKQAMQITAFPYEAVALRPSRWLKCIPWAKDGVRRGMPPFQKLEPGRRNGAKCWACGSAIEMCGKSQRLSIPSEASKP